MNTKVRKILNFIFFLLIICKANAQDPNLHIYLCFGQSNMEGQGTIEDQDKTVDASFKVFQALDCKKIGRTKESWYTAEPPLCNCFSKLSPADYFGRTLVDSLPEGISIGVINVAIGGCDIRLFDKEIYQDYDSTQEASWFTDKVAAYEWNPYQYLINLANKAQKDGVIKGILLHQGETNTGQEMWLSYVKKIYNDMLSDLSLNADSVPLLVGELVSTEDNCCASHNEIINCLPDSIPTSHIISSKGCTAQDRAHFDSEGYREMGRRYAYKMLELLPEIRINSDTVSTGMHFNNELSNPDLKVKLHPNPTKNSLELIFAKNHKKIQLNLVSMSGKLVYSKQYYQTERINLNLSDLPNGMYTLQIESDNQILSENIMVV